MTTTSSNQPSRRLALAVLLLACISAACFLRSERPPAKKLIVLGMDGLDPQLLRRFMDEGKLPNFKKLAEQGSFLPLGTSNPPQSPVAWSNLITGMNPGGHAIFDFIHRDPATLQPYLSTSKTEPPKHTLTIGSWKIPLSGGTVTLLRRGRASGSISTTTRSPRHLPDARQFPAGGKQSRTLAGMGTPDLLGTYGTFSFYTDDLFVAPGPVNGGRVYAVEPKVRATMSLEGPYNSFRTGDPAVTVPFTAWVDPAEPVAKIVIQENEILLKEREWSDWTRVEFHLAPTVNVTGIVKFLLKQTHPRFALYVTPINLDPGNPALPLSTPDDYASELAEEIGPYFTQGIAEDTKALSAGILSDEEYLQQARMVLAEHQRAFDAELARYRDGLFFFYFSSTDLNSHMFWRALDEHHPGYTPELAARHAGLVEELYVEMDRAVGKALEKAGSDTTVIVLSDHGFAPYYRSFNLNTWLLENGYLALKEGASREGDFFVNVDWSRTRAYGLGLNGLYLNLRGRERDGMVAPGAPADALAQELAAKLMALRDPENSQPVMGRVDRAAEAYSGNYVAEAPDLILGYNRGYRAGWSTVLGGFSNTLLEDNLEPWSGDHCMDPRQVPGVVLSNRRIVAAAPSLTDIAPTILSEFAIARPQQMAGQSIFSP